MDYSLYREYYPNWGRWLSADPEHGRSIDPQTQDLYIYVRNNPTNSVDPLGNVISSHCQPPGTFPDLGFFFFPPAGSNEPIILPQPLCVDGAWLGVSLFDLIPDLGIADTKSKTVGQKQLANGVSICTLKSHCTADTTPPICDPAETFQFPLIMGMSSSCYPYYNTTWLIERFSSTERYRCIPLIPLQNAVGTNDPSLGTCTH